MESRAAGRRVNPDDQRYMSVALRLAARALGRTSPNPAVGAVIVKGGRIIARGYHRKAGLAHAEVDALRSAGTRAAGSTMYVTLEPCTHVGRTPPCCGAITEAGIRRIVIATKDPNPITNGRGIRALRQAGLQVTTGVLKEDAKRLIAPFAKSITTKLPWVVAKVAQSVDGKIATTTGESRWISSPQAREATHQLRHQADAILVGVRTVLRDNPRLTARLPRPSFGSRRGRGRPGQPIVVIVDSRLRTPLSSRCLAGSTRARVIATLERSAAKRAPFERRGIDVLVFPASGGPGRRRSNGGRVPLGKLFRELVRRYGVTSLLIEGGGEVLASALAERLIDRAVWVVSPLILGGRQTPGAVGGHGILRLSQAVRLRKMAVQRVGPDLMLDAALTYPN